MPIFLLLLAAAGFALASRGRAATPGASQRQDPPQAVLARMGLVMAAQEPGSVREEIVRLRREGWHKQASELETKVLPKLERSKV